MSSTSSLPSPSSIGSSFDSDNGAKGNPHSTVKSSSMGPEPLAVPEASALNQDWSMMSLSPRGGPEGPSQWSIISASPKQSPPIQTMGRPGPSYDPSRIPSSIFGSKPGTTMDWSVASNDSLFSIHVGNNSFSLDNSVFSVKPDELSNSTIETKSNVMAPTLPTVAEGDPMRESATADVVAKETEEDHKRESSPPGGGFLSLTGSNVSDGRETVPGENARPSNTSSSPRLSGESGASTRSFAFPVLMGEGGRGSSMANLESSYNYHPNPPEKQQPKAEPQAQPQAQPVTLKAPEKRWFPCINCCCPIC